MRGWVGEKLAALQELGRVSGKPMPLRLPLDEPLSTVPRAFAKIFDP